MRLTIIMRVFLFCIAILLLSFAHESAAISGDTTKASFTITSTFPEPLMLPQRTMVIKGTKLNSVNEIFFQFKNGDQTKSAVKGMIQEKSDDAITVSVPIDVTGKIEIQLMDKDKNDLKIPVTIRQVRQVVYEAVEAKKNGLPEEMITDLLSGKFKDPVVGAFGKIDLSPDEIKLLKDEKFSEKFISDIGGSLQYVTFGLAGIRLDKTAEVVAAPMLRIFIVPKSFYAPRKDLFEIKYNWLPVPSGLFSLDKWDLNIGLTSSASTSDNSATNDNKNYVLVGFSFEINRSALFNVGRAFVPGNTTGEKSQWYFGITVDQNFFKDIGFIK